MNFHYFFQTGLNVRHYLNVLFTTLITNTLAVVFWRGLWTLANIHLYPEDINLSALYSFLVSYTLAIPVVGFECIRTKIMSQSDYKYKRFLVILFKNLIFVLGGIISIFHWRGIWLFQDSFIVPDNLTLSATISHLTGYIMLMFLFSTASILTCGCQLDSTLEDSWVFDLNYIVEIKQLLNSTRTETRITHLKQECQQSI